LYIICRFFEKKFHDFFFLERCLGVYKLGRKMTNEEGNSDSDVRETDSDSDSYEGERVNSPEQRRAGRALRTVASVVAFDYSDVKEFGPAFVDRAAKSLRSLCTSPADIKVMQVKTETNRAFWLLFFLCI
jgi:hypothetical protein